MKRNLALTIATAVLAVGASMDAPRAAGRFDEKLSRDRQLLQVLNRLTFGPRPGEIEDVRRLGLERWIDLQLHPERLAENPTLDAKLEPLVTLRMAPAEILRDYPAVAPSTVPPVPIANLLPPDQVRAVVSGTPTEREAVLRPLPAPLRRQVLALVPLPALSTSTPELQTEAAAARQAEADERQREMHRLMPPLAELLSPDEMSTALRGSPAQLRTLLDSLDPVRRQQVAAVLPGQAVAEMGDVRRLGMRLRQPQQVVSADLREGKVYRALYSTRQLEEVLVDFWFNHFNVYKAKAADRILLASYERDAIRPHVLGHFRDLLLATARHPAMLYYLDNWESTSPEAFEMGPFAGTAATTAQQLSRQAHGLNENYGREVMELHTLGVDGGYTQQDVVAVARCLTGWTIRQPNTDPEFVFAPFMHDTREKIVLGHRIAAGGGEQDGVQVLDILAREPATAKFISRKLAQRFVADDPPQSLVDRMAATFQKTDGDLRAVLSTMFESTEFLSEGAWQAKVKSPLEVVVSAMRATGADVNDTSSLAQRVADLGEPLYNKLDPTGYSMMGGAWLGTSALLGRMNFASSLLSGIPGVKIEEARWSGDVPGVARQLLGRDPTPATLAAIEQGFRGHEENRRVLMALVIGSPDFQTR